MNKKGNTRQAGRQKGATRIESKMEGVAVKCGTLWVDQGPNTGRRKGVKKRKKEYFKLKVRRRTLEFILKRKLRDLASSLKMKHYCHSCIIIQTSVSALPVRR
jgi:hypothetical protein